MSMAALHSRIDSTHTLSADSSGLGVEDSEANAGNHLMLVGAPIACASEDSDQNLGIYGHCNQDVRVVSSYDMPSKDTRRVGAP